MANKNKERGKAGEREVAKILTGFFADHRLPDGSPVEFRRVIGSGAHASVFNRMPYEMQLTMVGDVFGPVSFPYVIECKRRKSDELYKLLTGVAHEFDEWWEQVDREAERVKKTPMLVIKHDRKIIAVVTRVGELVPEPNPSSAPNNHFVFYRNGVAFVLLPLDQALRYIAAKWQDGVVPVLNSYQENPT